MALIPKTLNLGNDHLWLMFFLANHVNNSTSSGTYLLKLAYINIVATSF